MRKYVGISLGNNTSAAVVSPQGIEFAISEERLNGEKNTKKFPINALKQAIGKLGLKDGSTDTVQIGISSYEVINDRTMKYMDDKKGLRAQFDDFYSFLKEYIHQECGLPEEVSVALKRVEHHTAHMLPAVHMSGFLFEDGKTISVTYDGFGDGTCATIVDHSTGETLFRKPMSLSLGLVYQFVTGALGFKEHQHEGKITGLAAYGQPLYVDMFRNNIINYHSESNAFFSNYMHNFNVPTDPTDDIEYNKNIWNFDYLLTMKDNVYFLVKYLTGLGATREDIAASVQKYTEDLITEWINDVLDLNEVGDCNIVLSGGLFANVKVNYQVKMESECKRLFVLPPMGDEGTAIGAALAIMPAQEYTPKLAEDKLYLGTIKPDHLPGSDIDHDKYRVFNLMGDRDPLLQSLIPRMLADKRIVCMSRGHSEFGPRALGNHSILFDASEKETNDSLNKRLSRNEFMPFAPITLDMFMEDLFENIGGLYKTLKYMTIAVPVKEEFLSYKAAYHVDQTARPQMLTMGDNYILYNIIKKYSQLTGRKALINTSFNLHNSPIIFSEKVAYESFTKADLDVLVLNDKIIVKKECLK
jgi:carbamoyltransferase